MPVLLVRACVSTMSDAPSAQLLLFLGGCSAKARVLYDGLQNCGAEMDDSWLTVWPHGVLGCKLLLSHVVSYAVYRHYRFGGTHPWVSDCLHQTLSCSGRLQCYLTVILAEQTVRLSYGLQQLQHSSMACGRLLSLGSPYVRAVL